MKCVKRQKRSYVILLLMSFFLIFTTVGIFFGIWDLLTYAETDGVVVNVKVYDREGGTTGDKYYYKESVVTCKYTVKGREYTARYTEKGDLSSYKGETIGIYYERSNPNKSTMWSSEWLRNISSVCGSIFFVCWIISDIKQWVKLRKEENLNFSLAFMSEKDREEYLIAAVKKKKTNTILTVLSIVGSIFLFFNIPLVAYTIARKIDYKYCYGFIPEKFLPKNV